MRELISAFLLFVFSTLLLPHLWSRYMSNAPEWVEQAIATISIILGVVLLLSTDWATSRLTAPKQHPLSSLLIVGLSGAAIFCSFWFFVIAPRMPSSTPPRAAGEQAGQASPGPPPLEITIKGIAVSQAFPPRPNEKPLMTASAWVEIVNRVGTVSLRFSLTNPQTKETLMAAPLSATSVNERQLPVGPYPSWLMIKHFDQPIVIQGPNDVSGNLHFYWPSRADGRDHDIANVFPTMVITDTISGRTYTVDMTKDTPSSSPFRRVITRGPGSETASTVAAKTPQQIPPPQSPIPAVAAPAAPARPSTDDVLQTLAGFLEEGRRLKELYVKQRGADTVKKEIDAWFTKTLAYIRANVGADYAARYRIVPPGGYAIDGFPYAKMPVVHGIDARLNHLSAFMVEIRQAR
jgi:hypothetical protein